MVCKQSASEAVGCETNRYSDMVDVLAVIKSCYVCSVGFQSCPNLDAFLLLKLPHLIALFKTTSSKKNRDILLNAISAAVDVFHQWRGEILHSDDIMLSHAFAFPDCIAHKRDNKQLLGLFTRSDKNWSFTACNISGCVNKFAFGTFGMTACMIATNDVRQNNKLTPVFFAQSAKHVWWCIHMVLYTHGITPSKHGTWFTVYLINITKVIQYQHVWSSLHSWHTPLHRTYIIPRYLMMGYMLLCTI